jgi:hypothetical protein
MRPLREMALMSGFTTRDFKAAEAPDPTAVAAAGEQLEIARQALLKAGHHLDASPTRRLHKNTLDAKDRVNGLSIRLTEFVGG